MAELEDTVSAELDDNTDEKLAERLDAFELLIAILLTEMLLITELLLFTLF